MRKVFKFTMFALVGLCVMMLSSCEKKYSSLKYDFTSSYPISTELGSIETIAQLETICVMFRASSEAQTKLNFKDITEREAEAIAVAYFDAMIAEMDKVELKFEDGDHYSVALQNVTTDHTKIIKEKRYSID